MSATAQRREYCAVVFTSQRARDESGRFVDEAGYAAASERMAGLAAEQPGYLGMDSTRGADGLGVTVSYWASEDDAHAWGRHHEHREVQRLGRDHWYAWYTTRVAIVAGAWVSGPSHPGSA